MSVHINVRDKPAGIELPREKIWIDIMLLYTTSIDMISLDISTTALMQTVNGVQLAQTHSQERTVQKDMPTINIADRLLQ